MTTGQEWLNPRLSPPWGWQARRQRLRLQAAAREPISDDNLSSISAWVTNFSPLSSNTGGQSRCRSRLPRSTCQAVGFSWLKENEQKLEFASLPESSHQPKNLRATNSSNKQNNLIVSMIVITVYVHELKYWLHVSCFLGLRYPSARRVHIA